MQSFEVSQGHQENSGRPGQTMNAGPSYDQLHVKYEYLGQLVCLNRIFFYFLIENESDLNTLTCITMQQQFLIISLLSIYWVS